MSSSGKPKKCSGYGPPDTDFYCSTSNSSQVSKQQLVRGLHIDNLIAHEIDDFIDHQLRGDCSQSSSSGPKSSIRITLSVTVRWMHAL